MADPHPMVEDMAKRTAKASRSALGQTPSVAALATRTVQQGRPSNPSRMPGSPVYHVATRNGSRTTADAPYVNMNHYGRNP